MKGARYPKLGLSIKFARKTSLGEVRRGRPTAWEAGTLPLSYARTTLCCLKHPFKLLYSIQELQKNQDCKKVWAKF